MHSRIISEMLPEIHTMEKCDFLKSIINLNQCSRRYRSTGATRRNDVV